MLAIPAITLPRSASAQESEQNLNLDAELDLDEDPEPALETDVDPETDAELDLDSDTESAAGDFDPWTGVEEFIIRGEGMGALSVEHTVSVTAFDAATLEALGVEDISDLAAVTPNLSINTISASTPTFFIRGVGLNDFASNATGAVAVYQDGIPISSPALQLGQLFDSSVEVFRGPQAWGNERNASAGVIAASSRLPTGEVEAKLRVDMGNWNFRDYEGALAAPISPDGTLSARVAFRYTERDPYVRNRCGGYARPEDVECGANERFQTDPVPAGLPDEVGDQERWAVRGLLRFQPANTDMDWILNIHGSSIDQQSALGQVIGTRFPDVLNVADYIDPAVFKIFDARVKKSQAEGLSRREARLKAYLPTLREVTKSIKKAKPLKGAYDMVGKEKLDAVGGSLRGRLSLGDIEVETISGMESYDRERGTDFDFSPDRTLNSDADDKAWQATQSLELNGELEQLGVTWNAGGFLLFERLDSDTDFEFNFNAGVRPPPREIRQSYDQDNTSFGVFGNFEWEFAEVFSLQAGARFNSDKKEFELSVSRIGRPGNLSPSDTAKTWTAPTGAIALRYSPTEDVSFYAKFSRGWKPGVFNAAVLFNQDTGGGTFAPEIKKTDPEEIDAFEIGLNASWFDGAVETRAALFYYKYSDYQVFIFRNSFGAPPQFEIVNANDAQIYGAEVDIYAEPLAGRVPSFFERLILEARFSWLESEFLDFTDTNTIATGAGFITEEVDFSGNRLPNSPRFKVSVSARYAFDLGRFGTITPRYDMVYTGEIFFDPSEGRGKLRSPELGLAPTLPKYSVGQRAYVLHDVRLSYLLPGDQIEIAGWVRNLTDERYKAYVAEATGVQSLLNWIGAPRTYGGSLSFTW